MCTEHNPLECIIPPHMNKNIAENGSPEQSEKAKNRVNFLGAFACRTSGPYCDDRPCQTRSSRWKTTQCVHRQ